MRSIHCPPGRFMVCLTYRSSRLRTQIATSSFERLQDRDHERGKGYIVSVSEWRSMGYMVRHVNPFTD